MPNFDSLFSYVKMTDFALELFKFLYKIDGLNSIKKYFVQCNPKYKIHVDNPKIDLRGIFLETSLDGIKIENSKTSNGKPIARWFEYPFVIKDKTYFLSNQWSEEGDKANPTFKELSKVVPFCYPGYSIKKNNAKYVLYRIQIEDDDTLEMQAESNSNKDSTIPFNIDVLIKSVLSTNLIYSDILIKRLAYSLLTKPFVILSGLAGSGKTQLALAMAKSLVEDEKKQLCVVSVGADWTNREPLLGYPNALEAGKYVRPESGVLDLLIECNKKENQDKPFFLILDEMNLSYVERYFADFLSAMESHQAIKLWKRTSDCKDETEEEVYLTNNLFIIGTINVDETTYMFSPKVLDRANVIEFAVSVDDMSNFLDESPEVDIANCEGLAADMAADFVKIASSKKEMSKEANEVLNDFFKNLKKANAEFGYRTATEIGRFISLASESMGTENAVDAAIVQKLLPKLHGSRKKIVSVTKELWKLCDCEDLDTLESPDPSVAKYKLTADKVLRMYNSALENGFTSFAEA